MRRLFAVIVFIFGSVQIAMSETAVLRSAEHDDFTRIALDLSNPEGVSLAKGEGLLVVGLPKSIDSVQSKDFFRRISRKVIDSLEIDSAEHRIELRLACDCALNSFVAGPKMFVIDIREKEMSDIGSENKPNTEYWGFAHESQEGRLQYGKLKATSRPETPETQLVDTQVSDSDMRLPVVLSNGIGVENNSSQLRLLSNLEAAAQQAVELDTEQSLDETSEQITFRSNRMVQSKALPEIERSAQMTLGKCDALEHMQPSTWPSFEDAQHFLSQQRRNLGSEGVELNDKGLRALAMAYLSLAMGAEAKAILGATALPVASDEDLIEVSRFVDGDADARIRTGLHCPDLIVWKLLNESEYKDNELSELALSETQLEQIRAEFDRWPAALRGIFSAKLAKRLILAGAADTAAFSLRRSTSAPEQRSGERAMVAATLANKTQGLEAAVDLLEPILSADEDTAPEAAIALTDMMLAQGDRLKPSQKAALEIYREEYEGTGLEADLIRARLRAAVYEGDFAQAVQLMAPYSKLARPTQINLILDEIGEAIVRIESDATFLKEAVSLPARDFNRVAKPLQEQIRKRMNALGFADLAVQLGDAREEGTLPADAQPREPRIDVSALLSNTAQQTGQPRSPLQTNSDDAARAGGTAADPKVAVESPPVPESAISQAVRSTQSVLDSVTTLKNDLSELGL